MLQARRNALPTETRKQHNFLLTTQYLNLAGQPVYHVLYGSCLRGFTILIFGFGNEILIESLILDFAAV
jgi:hypothetical protein